MIRVAVQIVDNTKKALDRYEKASRFGIDSAGNVYQREVKKAHGDHYTSQKYRHTLMVKNHIYRTAPFKTKGGWSIDVGTNLKIPLYWELGHNAYQAFWSKKYNQFFANKKLPRVFRRRRIWVPTLIAQAKEISAAYARQVAKVMNNA